MTHGYYWIEGGEFDLHDVVAECPDLFSGKTVAITAFDGGPISPDDHEKTLGWYEKQGVFYANEITDPAKLPHEQYDEWYVFDEKKEFDPVDVFVNYGLSLTDPRDRLKGIDPTWDQTGILHQIDQARELQEKFWRYVCSIKPRSFVMDGNFLVFGSICHEDVRLIKTKGLY